VKLLLTILPSVFVGVPLIYVVVWKCIFEKIFEAKNKKESLAKAQKLRTKSDVEIATK
jgi:hypothetical protein